MDRVRNHGKLIVLEGFDESGKSTQAKKLAADLGADYIKEPHDTESEVFNIRDLLTSASSERPCPTAEALLFAASRAQLVEEVIKPNIVSGYDTVCDRFVDSSLAYQGMGLGLGIEAIRSISDYSTGWVKPDVVFYLSLEWEDVLARRAASEKPKSRFDETTKAYFERVVSWFDLQCTLNPQTYVRIDAAQSVEEVYSSIRWAMFERLGV